MMKRVLCVAAAGQALARLCRGAGLRGLGGGGAPRQHLPAHAAPRRQRGRRLARRVTDARRRRPGAPAPAPERARARAAAAGRGRRARVGPRVAGAPGGGPARARRAPPGGGWPGPDAPHVGGHAGGPGGGRAGHAPHQTPRVGPGSGHDSPGGGDGPGASRAAHWEAPHRRSPSGGGGAHGGVSPEDVAGRLALLRCGGALAMADFAHDGCENSMEPARRANRVHEAVWLAVLRQGHSRSALLAGHSNRHRALLRFYIRLDPPVLL